MLTGFVWRFLGKYGAVRSRRYNDHDECVINRVCPLYLLHGLHQQECCAFAFKCTLGLKSLAMHGVA